MSKRFLVIGLGRFGTNIARALTELRQDVRCVEINQERVNELAASLHRVVRADATDPSVLRALRIAEYDVVVVAISEDVEASVTTCLNCKDLGARLLLATAKNEFHGRVLERLGVDRVIYPHRDMGARLAYSVTSGGIIDFIRLSEEYGIAELTAPPSLVSHTLRELNLTHRFGLNILAIRRGRDIIVSPGADERIVVGDVIVVIGNAHGISEIQEA